jgi:hypothetical protein
MTKPIDITFTVKETVAKGRRLFRNPVTGEQFWEPGEVVVEAPTVVDEQTFVPNPITKGEPSGTKVRGKTRRS